MTSAGLGRLRQAQRLDEKARPRTATRHRGGPRRPAEAHGGRERRSAGSDPKLVHRLQTKPSPEKREIRNAHRFLTTFALSRFPIHCQKCALGRGRRAVPCTACGALTVRPANTQ